MVLLFEAETCSRCGGSGHYSYCQRYGTTCFKCAGAKQVLTKRGRVAQALYTSLLSRPAYTLQPGDQIWDIVVTMGGDIGSKWYHVESVERKDDGTLFIGCQGMGFAGINPNKLTRVRLRDKERLANVKMIALAYQDILSKNGKEPAWLKTIAWG